jgi:lipoate-protein ligase A
VSRLQGSAEALHRREVAWSFRSVTWCEVTHPAVVLGSTQPDSHVASRNGPLEVVRRRSGGGAVLVEPDRVVWADVVVPLGDRLWHHDVGRAAWWLGEAWLAALADLDQGEGVVHRGGLVRSAWSPWVCFAGLGPGEVTIAGRKVLGMAQRRTRNGALFQCALPLAWDPAALLGALALSAEQRVAAALELQAGVQPLTAISSTQVEAALLSRLP